MKITAMGKINGKGVTYIYDDGNFTPDDERLNKALSDIEAIGGTYYPPKYDPINVYMAFKDRLFDSEPDISVSGELGTIPYEDGAIY